MTELLLHRRRVLHMWARGVPLGSSVASKNCYCRCAVLLTERAKGRSPGRELLRPPSRPLALLPPLSPRQYVINRHGAANPYEVSGTSGHFVNVDGTL